MTPPAKKKNSGSGESGAKRVGKTAAAKKTTPGKKRGRKKKPAFPGRALLAAFAAGLLLASAVFFFFRDDSSRTDAETARGEARSASAVDGGTSEKDAAGKARGSKPPTENRVVEAEKKTRGSGAETVTPAWRKRNKDASVSREVRMRDDADAGPPGSDAAERKESGEEGESERNSAIASALTDLRTLHYEEALSAPLDDRIRQVDYALMQAVWIKKLPASALRLFSVQDRLEGVEPYQYQIIDILPGKNAGDFLRTLRECLDVWAEGAQISPAGQDRWEVSFRGVITHTLRLYPGQASFFQPPADTAGRPDSAATPDAAARPTPPRMRKQGEEARMVIVMDDLGANASSVQKLLALDYPVTFAFWPHGAHTREGAVAAHARGREILVHQPMEPVGYPQVRPGPNVLLSGMPRERIRRILASSIAAVPYATGMNNHMGSRFTQDAAGVDEVILFLKERGLFMLDSLTHSRSVFDREGRRLGIRSYRRNVFLDVTHTRAKVLEELERAQRIALLTGQAVAIGHPLPETLAALRDWQTARDKRVRIVRLTDLAEE